MYPLISKLLFVFLMAFQDQSQSLNVISPRSPDSFKLESFFPIDSIHHVGELFGGGIIFYVDKTGKHGLICSMSNISNTGSVQLFNKQDPRSLRGRPDSVKLINQVFAVNDPDQAKELCENYTNPNFSSGVFSDWYLPSQDELEILFRSKDVVNKTLKALNQRIMNPLDKIYWSSSKFYNEIHNGDNILIDLDVGSIVIITRPIPGRYFVRAIRSF